MSDCIFCKIAQGDIPSQLIYEDDHVVAFHDLHPVAPVHVLIVPKIHVRNLEDLARHEQGEVILGQVLRVIPMVAASLGVNERGYRVINNCGPDGGQTIEHVHFHLIGGRALGEKMI